MQFGILNTRFNILFPALALLILSSGCKEPLGLESNVREIVDSQEILPMEMGIGWLYRATHFDAHANETGTVHENYTVVAVHVIAGENWYRLRFLDDPKTDILLAKRADGVYLLDQENVEHLYIQYPAHVGAELRMPYLRDPADKSRETIRTVISDAEQIEIAGIVFECVRFRERTRNTSTGAIEHFPYVDWYYTPGYGLVQAIEYRDDGAGQAYIARVQQLVVVQEPQ